MDNVVVAANRHEAPAGYRAHEAPARVRADLGDLPIDDAGELVDPDERLGFNDQAREVTAGNVVAHAVEAHVPVLLRL